MLSTTIRLLRQSRRKNRTISPTSTAPKAPSDSTPFTARRTKGDWSNSKLTWMSAGSTACICGSARRMAWITLSVEASARLVARM